MVPSDPISSLTLHRHARYRATHREVLGVSPVRSPIADFSASGSMPSGSPPLSSPWSRSLVTAFPSPATAAPSQKPPFQGQWSRPATSRPASLCPRPVRLPLPCLHRFAPDDGSFFASGPLRFSSPGSLNCFPCLHSPPGLLPPSGSKRSTGSAASRLAFRFRPIPSRSPPPVLFLGLAADHRSWFATFPETCCSSNLLEPHSLCSLTPFSVNPFRVSKNTISSTFISLVSKWLHRATLAIFVDKTGDPDCVVVPNRPQAAIKCMSATSRQNRQI